MSERQVKMRALVGEWAGTKKLWMMPGSPAEECESTASVALEACGQFATVRYTWSGDGNAREGLFVMRLATTPTKANVVWTDSWHMKDEFMVCPAERDDDAIISVKGSYPAPPGPDWGWRMAIRSDAPDGFQLVMHNITPDGQEALAVEATYRRALA